MQVDFLIVGQGLSGSWLSYECIQAGARVCLLDQVKAQSPSRLSAGIINPITGRRHVEVWLAPEILQHAQNAYGELGQKLNRTLLRKLDLLDHFPSTQMHDSFRDRIHQGGPYVSEFDPTTHTELPLHHPFGIGRIDPVFLIDLPAFLECWRQELIQLNALRDEAFDPDLLVVSDSAVQYQDIRADRIIFCDGTNQLADRFFPPLPFALNKGEVLILEIPGLPTDHLYKHGLTLVPLNSGAWWAGSSYQWSFDHADPTLEFRASATQALEQWLRIPFRVVDHLAGIRPATRERRPFVGLNPKNPRIGLLNGMGTKGVSLAPYFARQLVEHLSTGAPIHPEAVVSRFDRS